MLHRSPTRLPSSTHHHPPALPLLRASRARATAAAATTTPRHHRHPELCERVSSSRDLKSRSPVFVARQVVGLITRKDILPGTIEERVLADDHLAEVEDALKVIEGALQQGLTTLSTKGSKGAGRGLAKGVAAAADGREVPNGGGNPPPLRLRAAASGPSPRSPVQV